MRRHDWIVDMLSDLEEYARSNGLPDLAASVAATLAVARREASGIDGAGPAAPGTLGGERVH